MVSPNFRAGEENFHKKIFRPKNLPSNFGENLAQNFREFSRKFSRPTKKKIPKKSLVIFWAKIRDFAKIFQTYKEKNPENPPDHLPVKMTYSDDQISPL